MEWHYGYILGGDDGRQPIPVDDADEWGEWVKANKYGGPKDEHGFLGPCRVGSTEVGEAWVSTVFLTIDHAFGEGPPVLFETMVFGGDLDGEQERYCTWAEAETGHAEWVERVTEAQSA